MAIDFSKLAIAISTHNRPNYLQKVANAWSDTAPDYKEMYIFVHHPDGDKNFLPPKQCQVIHTGRIPEHAGCLSKTWNMAMQWAFRDPKIEWLACALDDAVILPGWAEILTKRDADLYVAPAGDIVFLMNRRVLQLVGWYDERFPLIGWQEWDWYARAIRALGLDRVVMEDAHGWKHNPIGLSDVWKHFGDGAAPTTCRRDLDGYAVDWFQKKWAMTPASMLDCLTNGVIPPPVEDEIQWYPWFKRD